MLSPLFLFIHFHKSKTNYPSEKKKKKKKKKERVCPLTSQIAFRGFQDLLIQLSCFFIFFKFFQAPTYISNVSCRFYYLYVRNFIIKSNDFRHVIKENWMPEIGQWQFFFGGGIFDEGLSIIIINADANANL